MRRRAKEIAWDYIPHEGKEKIILDLPGLDLISHSFYLDLIQQAQIDINDLCELSESTVELLMSHSVISLIKAGVCDFHGASHFRNIITNYWKSRFILKKLKLKNPFWLLPIFPNHNARRLIYRR